MRVFVIIPAAGLGTRMSAAAKSKGVAPTAAVKQFAELAGVPILVRTIRKFATLGQVSEIYVALRKPEADRFQARLVTESFRKPVHTVEGGVNRQQSVSNALNALNAKDEDIVLVHDAVRPFVDSEIISGVLSAAQKTGAAIAGIPAIDTVKQVERTAQGAIISSTIPRERIVLAQTPQGFRFGILKNAFDEAAAVGFTGTDEASLVERSGHDVAVVMGSPQNIKITTPADLELAEFFLSQESRRRGTLAG
ncbi:MAG: 2-C-methyl-D-erythritol 4-phosphate cytidylyltransferase [Acidobacteriales bacterium]|nr:2-C-methyl-D-erythritol 4-phosphate cytidylyltransferase [Terriglobales bacterium]